MKIVKLSKIEKNCLDSGKPSNTRGETVWLKRFKDYQIEKEDITELKLRMDIIPTL